MSDKSKQTTQPETEALCSSGQDGGEHQEEGNIVVWITRSGRFVKKQRRYEVHIIDEMECDVEGSVPDVFQVPGKLPQLPGVGLPFVVMPKLSPKTPPTPPFS